ncbi:14828_t:CDS:2 [Acaulospora morrowiae]|uniref:14828_t:CDS:1 n=1 Tax=Acaulospora morrowiae TaxID=94023 RepID=A0A9N9G3M4_9GLOM|nr:14828_t:CDS:2 [Acaulospora morrowiae]
MSDTKHIKVLYIHGRNRELFKIAAFSRVISSQTLKCKFLSEHFDVRCLDMETKDINKDIKLQEEEIRRFRPDVVVGSSYGGAIAVTLLQKGTWKGPTILLGQAFVKYANNDISKFWLPEGVEITLIHGTKDSIIPVEHSRLLATKGTHELVKLVEVDDQHELLSLIDNQWFLDLIQDVHNRKRNHSSSP